VKSRWTRPTTTTAISSTFVRVFDESKGSEHTEVPMDSMPLEEPCLPLLTSNCPGWICFAEKTHPQAIPYLSTAKSPQQILGVLIKKMLLEGKPSLWNALDSASNPLPSQQKPYVVSIQPCFDKKLEASRLVSAKRKE
jgi:iron only hydrogenase large subunit-like protein